MDITTFRIVAFVAVLAIALIGGIAPLLVKTSPSTDHFFSLGNCLAAGAFLAAGLIHMLPDGLGAMEDAGFVGEDGHFFIALLAVVGFSGAMFAERVAGVRGAAAETHVHAHGPSGGSSTIAYALLIVLSLHSVIAGMALGTEGEVAQAVVILFAIAAHKGTEAFALGVSLLRGGLTLSRTWVTVILFSGVTPLGIILGSVLSASIQGANAGQIEGAFDGLAAGTFLYIAASHIIPEEFESGLDRWTKYGLFATGLGIMTAVGLVV